MFRKAMSVLAAAAILSAGAVVLVIQYTTGGDNAIHANLSSQPETTPSTQIENEATRTPTSRRLTPLPSLTPTPTSTPTPTPKVVKKPMDSLESFQAGVNDVFYFQDPEFREKVAPNLDRLVDLNVNHISVVIPIYQDGYEATVIYNHPTNTPKREDISFFITEAHKRGFTITLRPLMDEEVFIPEGQWRGSLRPTSVDLWFESYSALITDYAKFAEEYDVEFFSIGSEFSDLEHYNEHWLNVIASVRTVYTGQITYATNWDPSWSNFPLAATPWKLALDFESIDAYFRIDAPNDATVEQMAAAWQPWVTVITDSGRTLDSLVFAEIGVIPREGAHRIPYIWESSAPIDEEMQRRFYAAACQVFGGKIRGLHWWLIDLRLPDDADFINNFNPLGRPAEQEIASCYAQTP